MMGSGSADVLEQDNAVVLSGAKDLAHPPKVAGPSAALRYGRVDHSVDETTCSLIRFEEVCQ